MTEIKAIGPACELGEGVLWHPTRQRLFWFDIPSGHLHSCDEDGEALSTIEIGEPASCAGWVDEDTLVIATATGLFRLGLVDEERTILCPVEASNAVTRSNDGRVGPDGSLWFSTMGYRAERRAGAAYRYHHGTLTTLVPDMTIPNATCFSPDGRLAYLADTARRQIWRWELDETGAPVGEREVYLDLRAEGVNPDGAVCDAEGYLWNAQYGASRVARYAPDGTLDRVIELPASQITCPGFGGADLKTLYVTSATQGLSEEQLQSEPMAGQTFAIPVDVPGLSENRLVL